ncbi:leucine-rich repeat protein [bacterium]|nr:leucine-rich repeat protein [bacterium]
MKSCPNCQAQIPDENKFCSKCGYKIPEPTKPKFIYCPGYNDGEILFECLKCCSQFSSEDGKFCPQCGNQVPNSMNGPSLMPWSDIPNEVSLRLRFPENKKFVNNGTIELPFVVYRNGKIPTIITEIETDALFYDDKPHIDNILKIPITIKKIPEEFGYGLRLGYLSKIEIPKNNNIKYIGHKIFYNDSVYQKTSLDIGNLFDSNKLKIIGSQAFQRKLKGDIILPNSLEKIYSYAFAYANTTIVVPNTVKEIGDNAFIGLLFIITVHLKVMEQKNGEQKNCIIIILTGTKDKISTSPHIELSQ